MPDYRPLFQTKRFDVCRVFVRRNPDLGFSRHVYLAWHRHKDIPRPVCVVTLHGQFVEWCETTELSRRMGIATEVLEGLAKREGALHYEGVTEAGRGLAAHLDARRKAMA